MYRYRILESHVFHANIFLFVVEVLENIRVDRESLLLEKEGLKKNSKFIRNYSSSRNKEIYIYI